MSNPKLRILVVDDDPSNRQTLEDRLKAEADWELEVACVPDAAGALDVLRQGFLDLTRRGRTASIAKMVVKPLWKFFDCYFLRRGFLDGIPGLIIAINAAHSMFLKYAYFFEDNHASPRH